MSKAGKQFSLVGGVGSGAGAYAMASAANQTGNLLNMDPTVLTPNVAIGHSVANFGGKKVRFGTVSKMGGHAFDYPDLAVKNASGNGQSYKASKGGYLPGNNGAGQAGFGTSIDFDRATMVSEDLQMAQGIAMRQATIGADMYAPEHTRTVNREHEEMREHLEEQQKEHEKQKIKHLMAHGFSEREIAEKAMRDREKAIDQVTKMGMPVSASLSDTIMKMAPSASEKFWNNSIAPGLMPNRKDADSYQRATGLGTLTTKGKAAQAMRQKEAMALKIDAEQPKAKTPMKHADIVQMMMGLAVQEEHKRHEQSKVQEEKIIQHQKIREHARMARHFAMEQAMKRTD